MRDFKLTHDCDGVIYVFRLDGNELTLVGGPAWSTVGTDALHEFTSRPSKAQVLAGLRTLWGRTYEDDFALAPVLDAVGGLS